MKVSKILYINKIIFPMFLFEVFIDIGLLLITKQLTDKPINSSIIFYQVSNIIKMHHIVFQ